MEKVFDNLINGNIYDAKKAAERFGLIALALYFQDYCGMSRNAAIAASYFLKGRCTFQAYCDAK